MPTYFHQVFRRITCQHISRTFLEDFFTDANIFPEDVLKGFLHQSNIFRVIQYVSSKIPGKISDHNFWDRLEGGETSGDCVRVFLVLPRHTCPPTTPHQTLEFLQMLTLVFFLFQSVFSLLFNTIDLSMTVDCVNHVNHGAKIFPVQAGTKVFVFHRGSPVWADRNKTSKRLAEKYEGI